MTDGHLGRTHTIEHQSKTTALLIDQSGLSSTNRGGADRKIARTGCLDGPNFVAAVPAAWLLGAGVGQSGTKRLAPNTVSGIPPSLSITQISKIEEFA